MTLDVEAQVQFATEFVLFLVALAGLALSLLRAELLTRSVPLRLVLAVAFAALGGAAIVHGSLIIRDPADLVVVAARAGGWIALGVGSLRWEGGRWSRRLIVAAVVLGLGDVGAAIVGLDMVAAGLRAVASVCAGGALLEASRRAIAARVAASAAATLLLVVLVLSVGLSAVLSNTVEDQAISAVDARAVREANLMEGAREQAISAALLTSAGLAGGLRTAPMLREINDQGGATAEQAAVISGILVDFTTNFFPNVALAYADTETGIVATAGLSRRSFAALLDSTATRRAQGSNEAAGDIVAVDDEAAALGAVAVTTAPAEGSEALGLVIAVVQIDDDYLERRVAAEDPVDLALWTRSRVIASHGGQPPMEVALAAARDVLGGAEAAISVTEERFVSARAVRSQSGAPLFALVSSRPTTAVVDVRERLFQTFFAIAFGGTLLALLLAAVVGDRIGAGVRRLTRSTEALERGEVGVRSGVRSQDEVGRLGSAFDAMAESIEEKTDALRQAALDEAALRNRLEAIVAGMGEALVAVDQAGHVTDLNQAGEELLGVAAEAAKGQAVVDVVRLTNEEGVDLSDHLKPVDDRWSEIAEVQDATGDHVPVAITAGPLRAPDGGVAGRVLVLRDLRAEREVERMKREFLSRVGHELRTPLTPLLGYARILAGREVPPNRAQEISKAMVASGRRLEKIVEALEFFASDQAGGTVLRPDHIDVRELVVSVVEERQRATDGNSHVVTRRVRAGTPAVLGDVRWLRRSIDELLDNALKFSPAGGRVSVTAGPVDGFVEISVKDTGVGMTAQELERAFTEWAQGDESDTRAYGGLGLGLALVQRVVERHGGRVVCETAPGKGSKFSILVPAADREVE